RVLAEIEDKLTRAAVAVNVARGAGNRTAAVAVPADDDAGFRSRLVELLSEHDESLLQDFVDDEAAVSSRRLREALAAQTAQAVAYPVFCGSAITGAGVDLLAAGAVELLPASDGNREGAAAGLVFKIERSPAGERIAFVRMFSGAVQVRDRVRF